jgi:hypothetical protein
MRRIINYAWIVFAAASCTKLDNYTGPKETLMGTIIDSSTGQPLQSSTGDLRLAAYELSWGTATGNTVTPEYFNIKSDGTFINTKIFKGNYRLYPTDGAFVPLVYTNSSGAQVDAGSDTVEVSGVKKLVFTVSPFLKVEWVGEPVLNADKTVTVSVKVSRGTAVPDRIFNVTDLYLFISTTPFDGNGSFDSKLSVQVSYSGTAGNLILGQTVAITSKAPLGASRPYFVRVGARTADNVNKRYNYNVPKQVNVP